MADLGRIILEGIARRRAAPLDTPDCLQTLAEATYRDGTPVENHIAVDTVLFLLFAGHETTTGPVCWAALTFASHPEFLDRVRAECATVLGPDPATVPTLEQLSRLKSLHNGISEVLRLYPPAFALTRIASESFTYKNYTIPKGAMVVASGAVTHGIEALWHDAGSFVPERWNDETPRSMRDRFLTFGGGIHSCLGVHFARLEMKVLLLALIRHFDLSVSGEIRPRGGPAVNWPDAWSRIACRARRAAPAACPAPGAVAAGGGR